MAATDSHWGGIVQELRLDATARTVDVDIRVVDGGEISLWRLGLAGVSQLRLDRPDPEAWDYTELTEVHVEEGGDGRQRVELVFWVEPNGLSATCDEVSVSRL
jgi:hypothetical protein